MNLYLDASSLLKLYLAEEHSSSVRDLVATSSSVTSSLVAYAECRAGLGRAYALRRIEEPDLDRFVAAFESDWSAYTPIPVTEPLVRLAGELAEQYVLRGFDAIHLASAVTLQRELDEPITFSAFDERLSRSALAEGLLHP